MESNINTGVIECHVGLQLTMAHRLNKDLPLMKFTSVTDHRYTMSKFIPIELSFLHVNSLVAAPVSAKLSINV